MNIFMENDKRKLDEKFHAGILKASRMIYLNDPIDKESAYKTNRSLLMLDEFNNNPIKVFINSPGGEVNSGFFIFDCIRFIRSPVYVIGAGLVASAAALIYLAVDKQYRLSLPHARYMLHQPLSGSRGVVSDLEIHAKEVEDLKSLINNIIAEATNNSLKRVEEDTDRDFWLNPVEAKKYGMVDTIITNKDDFSKIFPKPKATKEKKTTSKTSDTEKKSTSKATSKSGSSTSSKSKRKAEEKPKSKTAEKSTRKAPAKKPPKKTKSSDKK